MSLCISAVNFVQFLKTRKLMFLFFLCMTNQVFPQKAKVDLQENQIIDSLQTAISNSSSDSVKCLLNYKLASIYYRKSQLDHYKIYLLRGNKLVGRNPFLKNLSYYYSAMQWPLSDDEDGRKKFEKAYQTANLKLQKYHQPEILTIRSTILFNLALVHQRENDEVTAIKILINQALPIAKEANNSVEISNIYRFLGLIFYNKDDLPKAEKYVRLAINTLETNKNNSETFTEDLLQFYLFYVEILSRENKLKIAHEYLLKAQVVLKSFSDSNFYIDYYTAAGTLAHQSKKYNQAIVLFDKGIEYAQKESNTYSITNLKLLKFESLKELKSYVAAKNLLLEVLNNPETNIEDQKNYSKDLAWILKQLKDYAGALHYSERYIILRDSLDEINQKNEIARLEAKYKNQENELKINELENQKQKALLKSKYNQVLYLLFGLASLILLLIIIFLVINAKNQKRILIQKEINYQQSIKSLKIEKELDIMQAIITAEEEERKRIARDLHDGIGSRLSSLKMQLQTLSPQKNFHDGIDNISESLSFSISELRQIALNLMPETLLQLGLEQAIRDLCYSLSNEGIAVDFHSHGISHPIDENKQIIIFRIVQELINNALKHSKCSEIMVDCSQNEHLFLLTVEDNGIGFKLDKSIQDKGMGIKNLKNRVELLQGKIGMSSELGKGTTVNIELTL